MLSILEVIPPIGLAGIGVSAFFAWSKARAIDRWMAIHDGRTVVNCTMPARPRHDLLPAPDLY